MSFLNNTKSVDGIMSAFTKTISDLEGVQTASMQAAERAKEEAARLLAEANHSLSEADRASSIATKLRSICSV